MMCDMIIIIVMVMCDSLIYTIIIYSVDVVVAIQIQPIHASSVIFSKCDSITDAAHEMVFEYFDYYYDLYFFLLEKSLGKKIQNPCYVVCNGHQCATIGVQMQANTRMEIMALY